jgi:hypothetical protein
MKRIPLALGHGVGRERGLLPRPGQRKGLMAVEPLERVERFLDLPGRPARSGVLHQRQHQLLQRARLLAAPEAGEQLPPARRDPSEGEEVAVPVATALDPPARGDRVAHEHEELHQREERLPGDLPRPEGAVEGVPGRVRGLRGEAELPVAVRLAQADERVKEMEGARHVPPRAQVPDQLRFQQAGLLVRGTHLDLDPFRILHDGPHLEMLLPPLGVAVLAEPAAEVLGLPYIDETTQSVINPVNSRLRRQA